MNYNNMTTKRNFTDPADPMGRVWFIGTQYAVPYERNDEYLKLINQEDPRNPETLLEPESGKLLYADVDFEYNYYAPKFEQFTVHAINSANNADPHLATKHLHIPSLNLFLLSGSEIVENDVEFASVFLANTSVYKQQMMPPPGLTPGISFDTWFSTITEPAPIEILERHILSLEYFQNVGDSYDHLHNWAYLSNYTSPSQHGTIYEAKYNFLEDFMPGYQKPEFINIDMARIYADNQNKREMYPYFAKLKLCGVQKNGFCDILENTGLVEEFIDFLVMHREEGKHIDVNYQRNTPLPDGGYQAENFVSDVYFYTLDQFKTHIEHHSSNNIISYNPNQTTCSFFEAWINQQLFVSTLDQWMDTAPTHQSVPVAFRLEKHAESGHISTHYFFNYTDLLEFKYYDSMVAFQSKFVYNMTVINSYIYHSEGNNLKWLLFFEEPFYSEEIFILDSPPIAPDVEILTYRGVADRNLILLNQMIDKEALVPIEINPSDIENFDRQYSAQNIDRPNPIIFESDSPSDFEIFKLMEKPTSYADFVNGEYKFLRTDNANSFGYEDNIVPNQYYYYIFRAQDPHGYPSNPTPVYEFILIKEGETMYPKIRIVDFKKPDPPTQKSKSFKKYVKIGFSPRQYTTAYNTDLFDPNHPSYDPSFDQTDVSLGISEDNIIGSNRVFKFRIRSKNTGKLVDINVTFKKNQLIHE